MNSTLALKKSDYEQEVGEFMGWGRGEAAGDTPWEEVGQFVEQKILMDVKSGLRRFYWCGHPWSFLKPLATVTLRTGASTVSLPDDYGGVDGGAEVQIVNEGGVGLCPLKLIGPGEVKRLHTESPDSSGSPRAIAHRPMKTMPDGAMQLQELYVFPSADQDYTLTLPYYFTPNYLLDVTPYAYGGVEHHETILECCLAAAELRRDNVSGIHSAEAPRLIQVSISMDRRKQPTRLGYNRDRSDGQEDDWNGRGRTIGGGITINGTLYT